MARQPFFSGNYGSALARVDTRPIVEAGRAQGQMFANLGKQVSGAIEQYGLNKEKRAKLTGEIEAYYKENPNAISEIGMSGNEAQDKKDFLEREKFIKGDMNMAQLEGLAGKLARGDVLKTKYAQDEARAIANEMGRVNLDITNQLKDTRINIEKDKGVLSDLATKLAVEINPEKKKLLQAQMSDAIKNFGLGDARRELEKETIKSKKETLPSTTEATIARNETSVIQDEETQKRLPGQTSVILKQQEVQSKQLDVENQLMDIVGIEGYAQMKADDLKTLSETNKAKLQQTKAYASYLQNKGMADLITAANKSSPTFKDRFKPLAEMQGSLLSQNVQVPGEGKRVKFSEYLELHNEDSSKYPLTGLAGDLDAQLKTLELSTQNLLREQQVQVNVPDEVRPQSEPNSLKQSIENIPKVKANIETNREREKELARQRRDILNDPNSNIYLQ
jgi:hypothetical protein